MSSPVFPNSVSGVRFGALPGQALPVRAKALASGDRFVRFGHTTEEASGVPVKDLLLEDLVPQLIGAPEAMDQVLDGLFENDKATLAHFQDVDEDGGHLSVIRQQKEQSPHTLWFDFDSAQDRALGQLKDWFASRSHHHESANEAGSNATNPGAADSDTTGSNSSRALSRHLDSRPRLHDGLLELTMPCVDFKSKDDETQTFSVEPVRFYLYNNMLVSVNEGGNDGSDRVLQLLHETGVKDRSPAGVMMLALKEINHQNSRAITALEEDCDQLDDANNDQKEDAGRSYDDSEFLASLEKVVVRTERLERALARQSMVLEDLRQLSEAAESGPLLKKSKDFQKLQSELKLTLEYMSFLQKREQRIVDFHKMRNSEKTEENVRQLAIFSNRLAEVSNRLAITNNRMTAVGVATLPVMALSSYAGMNLWLPFTHSPITTILYTALSLGGTGGLWAYLKSRGWFGSEAEAAVSNDA